MTNADINDIRDIKPPIEIPDGLAWLWWTLGLLAASAILFTLWKWWRKRRAQVAFVLPIPAHVRAKQKLQDALALISQPKEFCILVSDTIRFYLEERFQFRAPERTTEEFLRELNATDLLVAEQKESLGKFLEGCDLVKFAKYEPRESELHGLHGSAMKLVEETEPRETQNSEARIQKPELKLEAAEEIALAKHLLNFGLTLEAVAEEYRPNFLCNYLFDLAGKFTAFYENCPVLKSEGTVRESRLALCDLTARVLKQGLGVLGIEVVDQM
jgi:glycyl-tRNA synthetase beta subunit